MENNEHKCTCAKCQAENDKNDIKVDENCNNTTKNDNINAENKQDIVHKPEISIDDFAKLEFRVGKILECEKVENADKLLKSRIKIGDEVRTIVSGIAQYYKPEEMVGKSVVVVANLKPAKLRGIMSEGMILCAQDENGLKVVNPEGEIIDGAEVR